MGRRGCELDSVHLGNADLVDPSSEIHLIGVPRHVGGAQPVSGVLCGVDSACACAWHGVLCGVDSACACAWHGVLCGVDSEARGEAAMDTRGVLQRWASMATWHAIGEDSGECCMPPTLHVHALHVHAHCTPPTLHVHAHGMPPTRHAHAWARAGRGAHLRDRGREVAAAGGASGPGA